MAKRRIRHRGLLKRKRCLYRHVFGSNRFASQRNQPTSQPTNPPTHQPTANQPIKYHQTPKPYESGASTHQLTDQTTKLAVPTNQPTDQSSSQPVHERSGPQQKQLMNESINRPTNHPSNELNQNQPNQAISTKTKLTIVLANAAEANPRTVAGGGTDPTHPP